MHKLGTRGALSERQARSAGALLGCFIGDALGAPFESWTAQAIRKDCGQIRDMKAGTHLGVGVSGGARRGMYTDDTNSLLALADSLAQCRSLDPKHIANNYVNFWKHEPKRGYPGSAQRVLKAIEAGVDYTRTATIKFPEGSYGNGGAMRIAPIGIAFAPGVEDSILHEAVRLAVMSTHVHPQAVDGAWIIAKGVNILASSKASELTPLSWLNTLAECARDKAMRDNILLIRKELEESYAEEHEEGGKRKKKEEKEVYMDRTRRKGGDGDDDLFEEDDEGAEEEEDPELDFLIYHFGDNQLMAVDAVSCALWCVVRCWTQPEEGIIKAVNLGGDTDTVGAITGALLGALHGVEWIPDRWWNELENGDYGKEWVLGLAERLAEIHLTAVV